MFFITPVIVLFSLIDLVFCYLSLLHLFEVPKESLRYPLEYGNIGKAIMFPLIHVAHHHNIQDEQCK